MAYKFSHTENFDGTVTRKRYEQFTRTDGSIFLDKPNTVTLRPQTKNSDGSWSDTDISSESQETRDFCSRYWTEDIKQAYRNNN